MIATNAPSTTNTTTMIDAASGDAIEIKKITTGKATNDRSK